MQLQVCSRTIESPNKTSQISVVRFNKIFLRWRESQNVTRIKGNLDDFGLSKLLT